MIDDLKVGDTNVTVEGTVVSMSDIRAVNTKYGKKKVADAVIEDKSGRIKLSLWEDQINMVEEGDDIKISPAYVTEWKDEKQLNLRRGGRIVVK